MPELPDLEVIRENLAARLLGRAVTAAAVRRPGLVQAGAADLSPLLGRTLRDLTRRGKYLLFHFDTDHTLLVHLMRYGWLWHGPSRYEVTKATTLVLSFNDGTDLRLIEPGTPQIAAVWLVSDLSQAEPLAKLGPEPLAPEFTLAAFAQALGGKRRILKKALTDQSIVAGIGNAYADEILFWARLSPFRYVHTLTPEELERLWRAIPETLRWAIGEIKARAGTNLFDKEIRDFLFVHGRAGAPCRVCGTPIGEVLLENQRTNYCPRCQSVSLR
ncbi:MAG: Fpg/Nei family DNA glycosylase [Candidatus Bipolaricaulota bacterium]|nr:Fpg/Nei family DNA glycosylase [Candidatus Bipolaricaulota bacterium]MDW8151909.1 DNA-formamidopyrimidine glycosylase family protein [Candidatus Bipolaricaulota bacterium]